MIRTVVVLGATSAIAHMATRRFAKTGAAFYLVGRDQAKLDTVAKDLVACGATSVQVDAVDLGNLAAIDPLVGRIAKTCAKVDVVLLAHGILGEQAESEKSFARAEEVFRVNFLSVVAFLTPMAARLEAQGSGAIAVIGSVAGDRGRQSNYVYGSSKAALATFTDGLRNRLYKRGVHVVTIKPGFTSTPMTAHIKQGPLYVSADVVGEGVFRAIERRTNIAYLPWFWCGIMTIIKAIPEFLFKRLSL